MPLTVEVAEQIADTMSRPNRHTGRARTLGGGFRAPDGAAFACADLNPESLVGAPSKALLTNFWMVPDQTADAFADRLADLWAQHGDQVALVGLWCAAVRDDGPHGYHLVGSIAAGSAPRLGRRPPAAFAELFDAGLGQLPLVTDHDDHWVFSLAEPLCRPLFTATANRAVIEAQLTTLWEACAPVEREDYLVALNDHLQDADDAHRDWVDARLAQWKAEIGLRR
jgi:hypothetical protein